MCVSEESGIILGRLEDRDDEGVKRTNGVKVCTMQQSLNLGSDY